MSKMLRVGGRVRKKNGVAFYDGEKVNAVTRIAPVGDGRVKVFTGVLGSDPWNFATSLLHEDGTEITGVEIYGTYVPVLALEETKVAPKPDNVNRPAHYTVGGVENGKEDLRKAIWYINRMLGDE